MYYYSEYFFFFFSSRRRHTRFDCDWSSDVCSSDLACRTSPPFQLNSGSGRESPTVGRRPRSPPGSPLSKPTWRLGAANTLRWARASARSDERRGAPAPGARRGAPPRGGPLSGGGGGGAGGAHRTASAGG